MPTYIGSSVYRECFAYPAGSCSRHGRITCRFGPLSEIHRLYHPLPPFVRSSSSFPYIRICQEVFVRPYRYHLRERPSSGACYHISLVRLSKLGSPISTNHSFGPPDNPYKRFKIRDLHEMQICFLGSLVLSPELGLRRSNCVGRIYRVSITAT